MIRTVLGDVPAAHLGRCDYHEHLFQVSPLLPGDELDDETASGAEAAALRAAGIDAMVEATPTGLGRDPAGVARISAATGLHVVHTTGGHRSEHYGSGHWLTECPEAELATRFGTDVREGLPAVDARDRGAPATGPGGAPVRAGLVKAGVGYWRIDAFERRVLAAAAATAVSTGVAVMVHLEHGSAAHEVLAALATDGLPADRVVLAHADRNLDPGLHAELTAAGVYLGYDGMARHREASDSAVLDCLERVAAGGGGDRLLLGGDVARRTRYRAYGGLPGLDYLPSRFLPRVRDRLGEELLNRLLVTNPARVLALTPRADLLSAS
ncbi:phosphotriesterase family protein [Pseudonocardia hierapolitana]|uniref:phosphotriesterase family protein n=1 Tax=Pseudonocardia hierapolitana TaxID=1128676 RepID=UPI001BAFF847|nr:phosphotriesterase [Pseudonocardia hierapolitana]